MYNHHHFLSINLVKEIKQIRLRLYTFGVIESGKNHLVSSVQSHHYQVAVYKGSALWSQPEDAPLSPRCHSLSLIAISPFLHTWIVQLAPWNACVPKRSDFAKCHRIWAFRGTEVGYSIPWCSEALTERSERCASLGHKTRQWIR